MAKSQKTCAILGFIFLFLHLAYVGGYSQNAFFKSYTLVIGLFFLIIDLIIFIFMYIKKFR
ncbi:hypothetical protein AN964_03600 [Heyndrickxia shackletonii]|uniref:Uncharacterized protein n=1 Tax=Heyndrickxia shackletonii TaxID=157838 RepID=A0A0Q3TF65_9BACI|nr:hypothetical protein AN964_03600 [Heyndrickxia shackletonii]